MWGKRRLSSNYCMLCMRKFIFLFATFLFAFTASDEIPRRIVLDWEQSDDLFVKEGNVSIAFQKEGFLNGDPVLPKYVEVVGLSCESQVVNWELTDPVYDLWQGDLSEKILTQLSAEPFLSVRTYRSGEQVAQEISLVPLVQREGQVYRILSFGLQKKLVKSASMSQQTYAWKNSSVLHSGMWKKIRVAGRGIYRIPYSRLKEWGFSNPDAVAVLGSGAATLSEDPGVITYDDLESNTVWVDQNKGEQCLFFYAPGAVSWKLNNAGYWVHQNNDYTTEGFFFLTENAALRLAPEQLPEFANNPDTVVNRFTDYAFWEEERYNILPENSGKRWFGQKFGSGSLRTVSVAVPGVDASQPVSLNVVAVARSYNASNMQVVADGEVLGTVGFSSVNTSDLYGLYADEGTKRFTVVPASENLGIQLTYMGANQSAEAWLDYVEVNYSRLLKVAEEPLFFRNSFTLGADRYIRFQIADADAQTRVMELSEPNRVKELPTTLTGTVLSATGKADQFREYVVFRSSGSFPEPELVGDVENQDLHGMATPEYVIVTYRDFLSAANELADFHRSHDGMDVAVVTADQVYNEFSSGTRNATGIRNFLKMLYDRGEGLKYVLLMGDGSYDNKGVNTSSQRFIPTYQSANSLTPTSSFVTDDYFVLLDAGESVYSGAIDLGIGRLPVKSAYEASLLVEKIKRYHQPEALGDWRNVICMIGDDEDYGLHMRQSEELADTINKNYKEFITHKIFLDAFTQETTPAGERYPEVNAAINEQVNEGALILNYIGHANDRFLAHEHVLEVNDINSWTNKYRMPVFVTATCEFSRFDADETSAGELILLNPNGGAIGLFSTTRVVYASENFVLSKSFYRHVFDNDNSGEHYRMGDVMRLAKINIGNSINKRNFSLLADPALKLSYPKYKVQTTAINQHAISVVDTIGALREVTVEGYVSDVFGQKIDDFSGTIIPTVYDKEMQIETLGNGGETPVKFGVRENVIYRGKTSVKNGTFSFRFVVPKDILYNIGKGKIVYYATSGEEDAHGAFDDFYIGGSGEEIVDNEGPAIQLWIDSPDFKPGDETGSNPTVYVTLSDPIGINTVGTGIGHDLTAVIDGDYSNVLVLNSYYQADIDDFSRGTLQFNLSGLAPGTHTLTFKAWDVANNSSEVTVDFVVSDKFVISELSNYPNPFSDYTYLRLEHNKAGEVLDVIFDIYDSFGRSVDRFQTVVGSLGGITNPVRWDPSQAARKVTPGIYVVRVIAHSNDGAIASATGKMVVVK